MPRIWPSPNRLLPFIFVLLALTLGCCYAVMIPPFEVPDEAAHLFRAYEISLGSCVGRHTTAIPQAILDFYGAYRNVPFHVTDIPGILIPQWPEASVMEQVNREVIGPSTANTNVEIRSANLYTCVPYAVTAAELAAAREFRLTAAHAFYLGRFVNLGVFAALVFLALRILPDLQLSMMCLALMPMTLHEAASFSADMLTLASTFLLTAYCFQLAFGSSDRLRAVQLAGLVLLTLFSSLCKFNLWLAFLVLLIPAQRFGRPWRRWLTLAACLLIPCAAAVLWQLLNQGNVEFYGQLRLANSGIDMKENAHFLARQPVAFLLAFWRTVVTFCGNYLGQFVGRLGLLSVRLPDYIVGLYSLLLVVTILVGSGSVRPRFSQRMLLAFIFAASFISIFCLLWIYETPRQSLALIRGGAGFVNGVQGRYFIPVAFPLLAACSFAGQMRLRRFTVVAAAFVVLALNTAALVTVRRAYSVRTADPAPSGAQPAALSPAKLAGYEGKLIRRPLPAAPSFEDQKVFLVYLGQRYWIPSALWITHHGFRWPEDVITVPAADVDAIPGGAELAVGAVIPLPPNTAAKRYAGLLVVQQPGNGPEEGKIFLVRDGLKHWVRNISTVEAAGYRVPNDMVMVSYAELSAIPTGSPIE